jgi:agmatine/peptidylarginine deiminase
VPDTNSVFFPPEWAHQSAVLLAWPYAEGAFSPWLADVEQTYLLIAAAISQRQKLIVACHDENLQQRIAQLLNERKIAADRIALIVLPYNDVWVRDTAPITVDTTDALRYLNFRFNAWGGKYEHDDDAALATRLHASGILGHHPIRHIDFVLEGGSLETDGAGTLLTTTRCLLNPNRNPELNQAQIEQKLKESLGLNRVLWLQHGYAEGDDTDAHIDTLARFCPNDTIAYTACNGCDDPLYGELKAMEAELQALRTTDNRPYHLVALPIPDIINSEDGERLPATYANFLVINGAVLVPTYDDTVADRIALERIAACFPDREIIAIPATPLIRQYGSIHCMTMQFPDFRLDDA